MPGIWEGEAEGLPVLAQGGQNKETLPEGGRAPQIEKNPKNLPSGLRRKNK